jgi:tetratricopeptide (TPR) repeat protein
MTTEPQAEPQAQNRRRGRRVSRARLIFVGVWVSAAIGALIWIEGPFWKDAVVWYEQARVAAAEGRWSDALEGIGEARAKVPDDPGLATFEGYTLLELDRPADAITSFRVALDSLPDDTQARLGLASALIALADTAAARDVLVGFRPPTDDTAALVRHAALAESIQEPAVALRSLEQAPTAANLSDRVRLALAAELWETAITLLEEEVATAGRPASEGELAWALERAGRRDEALERYADLHERRALDEQTGIRYVWMLDEDGRYGEAMQVLRSLPPGPEVSFLLARTALWAGDLAESAALVDVLEESGDPRAASLRAELEAEAARLARLREEGERRRLADTPPDDPELALAFWQDRVVRDPSDAAARGEAVALLESAGRFEEAARTLLGARTDSDPTGADEVAHLARLRHWGGQHELAVDLFGRLEELRAASGLEAGETLMLAESLLSLGRAAEAHDRLAPLADGASPTIEIVSAAARAATDAGRTTDAVRHLRGLAQIRPLDVAERRWLAGQLRSAGEVEAALAAYMDLRDLDPDDREAALAVADLELALGRYGPAASDYESLGMEGSDPATPRHAAALAELGRYEEAIRLYRSHLGAGDDAETRLALARTLARQGDPEAALAEYEVLLAVLDGNEIALELAQVHAALGAFGEARRWAEIAEERTGAWEARLLLAETAR